VIYSSNKTNEMHKFLKFIFELELYMFRNGFLSTKPVWHIPVDVYTGYKDIEKSIYKMSTKMLSCYPNKNTDSFLMPNRLKLTNSKCKMWLIHSAVFFDDLHFNLANQCNTINLKVGINIFSTYWYVTMVCKWQSQVHVSCYDNGTWEDLSKWPT